MKLHTLKKKSSSITKEKIFKNKIQKKKIIWEENENKEKIKKKHKKCYSIDEQKVSVAETKSIVLIQFKEEENLGGES